MVFRSKSVSSALLLILGAAHVQAQNVTAYGTLDVTVERVDSDGYLNRVSSNSSGFGFRGSESLGGKVRALFQIEGSIGADTGAGNTNGRDSFVGLSGNFGTLRIGLMTSPLRALGGKLNFVPGGTSMANNMGLMSRINGFHPGFNSRLPNSVQYAISPLKDWQLALVYAPGEARPAGFDDRTYGAAINYGQGPWFAGWAYENRAAQKKLALGDASDSEQRFAARYTMGELTLSVGWDRLASAGLFGNASGRVARDAWTAGMMFKRAQHDWMLHYSVAGDVACSGNAKTGQCAPAVASATGARQLSLLYHYSLSKRTTLVAFYSAIHNEAQALYEFDANAVVDALSARKPGARPRGVGWGVRHSF